MPSDTVTTIFGGDDSPFQAVAKRVLDTVKGIGSFKPPGDAFKAVHEGFKGVETTAKGAVGGLTALKGAFMELLPIVGAIAGVTGVVASFGRAISEASERETAAQRLSAVADAGENLTGVIEKLEAASAKTGRDFPELAKSVQGFKEAGIPIEAAAGYTEKLNEISLVTGKSLEDLTDVFTRMSVKGEASFKDLAKFIAVPGVAQLAKEFKALEVETGNLERATSKQIELWHREDEAAQNAASAINSFAKETGIAAATFNEWKASGLGQGRKIISIGDITGLGDVSQKVMKQFTEGMKQIEKETGLSELTIKKFLDAGKIGFESLISASQRYHEQQQKARDQAAQDRLRGQQEALVTRQQGLVQQVQALVQTGIDPAKLDAWFSTFAGKWYNFAHQIAETFESFGTPLLGALKPLIDHLNTDLAPTMKSVAENFGTWLSNTATDLMNAFGSGDWSKVQQDLQTAFQGAWDYIAGQIQTFGPAFADAINSPAVSQAIDLLVGIIATAIEKAVSSGFSEGMKQIPQSLPDIRKKVTDAGLNPFTKEFWMGGFGGVPVTPVAPPTPDNKGQQTTVTSPMSDEESVSTLDDILRQMTDLNKNLSGVLSGA